MNILRIKSKNKCKWDLVSLGEVLLRFDPGNDLIHTARSFQVFDGGGEYNVAKNLARCFRKQTTIVTALVNNGLGRLVEDLIRQGGVSPTEIIWHDSDKTDPQTRNGIYFIERGFGLRPPNSTFDRGNTAVSQLKTGDIDWQKIFVEKGAQWFHTGGIFTALSETTSEVGLEAVKAAKTSGSIVSYDLNYRNSLWKNRGGREAANALNRKFLPFADVVFGVFDFDPRLTGFNEGNFRYSCKKMREEFPNIKVIASTLRDVGSAQRHNLSGTCIFGKEIFKAKDYLSVEVFDRVGSGDAFAAGFIYGLMEEKDIQFALECGTAHAALVMTTAGDNSFSTVEEVQSLINDETLSAKR